MWNMPVHKWMVRHIYFPCLRNGNPKGIAIVIAFLISAIFHELNVQWNQITNPMGIGDHQPQSGQQVLLCARRDRENRTLRRHQGDY